MTAQAADISATKATLAAIVPATDRPLSLERCLEAIRNADEAPEEVVVVTEPAGAGPAAARNAGAARTRSDVLAFVDSDVVVHSDAFARLRRAFAADPGLVALFGSYDDAPEAPGAVSGFRNLLHHHVHQASAGHASSFWAGLGAVRRDAFLASGGFDEHRYPEPSIEDVELGMRLVDAGARIELDPEVQGTHLKAWTLVEATRTDFARRGAPWARLLIERRQMPEHLNLGWRHRMSAAVSVLGLAAVVARRPRVALGAALALVALNRSFYALLLRRRGPAQAAAGIGLHAIHHGVGAASVPAALVAEAHRPLEGARVSPGRRPRRASLDSMQARWRDATERRRARRRTGYRLLRAFARAYPEAFFIEIGANDGKREDPLAPFIRSTGWRGVMVEPVPHVFERLRDNYGDLDRVALEEVAISDRDGRLPFYHVAPAANAGPRPEGDYSDALGSFSRETVLTTAAAIPGAEGRVERIDVPCLSFESLCRRHGVGRLDLLAIDTEGYDYEIIKQIDFNLRRPRVLVYEHLFLTREERLDCRTTLERIGYELMEEAFDTWCVDARPADALTRRWRELRDAGPTVTENELLRWLKGMSDRAGT